MGVDRMLTECPASKPFPVADAARYRSDFDLSRSALLATPTPIAPDAAKAAFFLGRVEEALGHYEIASRWYAEAIDGRLDSVFLPEARAAKLRVGQHLPAQQGDAGHDAGKPLVAFTGGQTRRMLPLLCAALFGAAGCDVPRTHLAATRWTGTDGAAAGDVTARDGGAVQGRLNRASIRRDPRAP